MRSLLLILAGCLFAPVAHSSDAEYLSDIKPLLRKRCYACHGALRQEAGLRLDTVAGMLAGGDSGPVVQAGAVPDSILIDRLSETDPDLRMPPEHEGEPFTAAEVAVVKAWIQAGAAGPADEQPESDPREHWSFLPIERPEVPQPEDGQQTVHAIDAFISAARRDAGIEDQGPADSRQLLRRLTFDLIGLPPNVQQVTELGDRPADEWYGDLVDELLADPRHGERWARHWMDIWRYSDWWGLNAQLRRSQKHIWHWRDWIVESLNENKPYNQMLIEMLAADELYPNDLDRLRATGYLARNYHLFNRQQWMDETVEHVSKSLLGLTMNCAKCHDHKFDPVDQVDFYRMKAIFEPYMVRVDMVAGEPDVTRDGVPCVFDAKPEEPTYRLERGQESHPDKSTVIEPGVPGFLNAVPLVVERVELPAAAWQTARRPWVLESHLNQARQRLRRAEQQLAKLREKQTPSQETSSDSPQADAPPTAIQVAELDVAAAQAELNSRNARSAAMQAEWDADAASQSELNRKAIEAERAAAVAKAQHAVSSHERQLAAATDKTRAAAEKKLKESQKQLDEAQKKAVAEIGEKDTYSPFKGTRWTPTRFAFSGKDDEHPGFPTWSTGRRTALAQWITDASNPLTARVAVNHLWTRHMGQPLVASVFDFGRNGSLPTHPQLLDWLAAELIESGWDMKHIHRLIVTSQTYRLSSSTQGNEVALERDPDNQLWWRRTPLRLESQAIRDSVLSLAGTLDETRGGPVVLAKDQPKSRRRSLYFFHSNNSRNLMLSTFDEASVNECYRRETSIVPQQALALTNGRLIRESAGDVASQLLAGRTMSDSAFAEHTFHVLLGLTPQEQERARCVEAMQKWRELPETSEDDVYRLLVWALMNHNDFVTVQ